MPPLPRPDRRMADEPARPPAELGTIAWRPVPDPTELTDRAIARAEKSLTSYIDGQLAIRDERLAGIDRATELRLGGIEGIPTSIREQVEHLERLHDERFRSVDQRFVERDIRAEREARDNKVAVDAAFAAQKEAAAKQDEGNQKAIDKSETATAEKIDKLAELFRTTTDALADKIDDLKERQNAANATIAGSGAHREGSREGAADLRTVALFGLSLLAGALGLYAAIRP